MNKGVHVPITAEAKLTFKGIDSLLYRENGDYLLRRKAANNCLLTRQPFGVNLVLYGREILRWQPGDLVTLAANGCFTKVTMNTMNLWLPSHIQVYRRYSYWYVNGFEGEHAFHDGMMFDMLTSFEITPDGNEDLEAQKRRNHQINDLIEKWLENVPDYDKFQVSPMGTMKALGNEHPAILSMVGEKKYETWIFPVMQKWGYIGPIRKIVSTNPNVNYGHVISKATWRKFLRGMLYDGATSRRARPAPDTRR